MTPQKAENPTEIQKPVYVFCPDVYNEKRFVIFTAGQNLYEESENNSAMKCIYCNCSESRVVDSRPTEDGAIRRRRECEGCQRRFTTYEKIEMLPVFIVKKDKRREPFDPAKVRNGILKACEKRPVPLEEIEKLVQHVETTVCRQMEHEVTSDQIGLLIMDGLKELDEVAYIRFASVYRQFKDVQSFMQELQQLLDNQKKTEE